MGERGCSPGSGVLAAWHGEPKCSTSPSASLQPPSRSLLSCARKAPVWELGSSLVAVVSSVELCVPADSVVLVFCTTDPFRTMAVGQGIWIYFDSLGSVATPKIAVYLEFDNLGTFAPPLTLVCVNCWCTLVMALAQGGSISLGKGKRRPMCKAPRILPNASGASLSCLPAPAFSPQLLILREEPFSSAFGCALLCGRGWWRPRIKLSKTPTRFMRL